MGESFPAPVLIAGPTASGKSALAAMIADQVGGVIINADSMQVYRELRILSARPGADEEARVPHALYGFVPASEAYSVGQFVIDAAAAIIAQRFAGRRPIIVGGTGLYFKALTEGLSPIPAIDPAIRDHWRTKAARRGAVYLHRVLAGLDPSMAERLAPTDTQRIVRALEVIEQTGRSLSKWQRLKGAPFIDETKALRFVVTAERDELHARADTRFDLMMSNGALAEAEALAHLDLDPELPAMRAIGVRPLIAAVRGERTVEDAVAAAKLETRQYIKRQMTWLKRYMIAWKSLNAQQIEISMSEILSFIQRQP